MIKILTTIQIIYLIKIYFPLIEIKNFQNTMKIKVINIQMREIQIKQQ